MWKPYDGDNESNRRCGAGDGEDAGDEDDSRPEHDGRREQGGVLHIGGCKGDPSQWGPQ